MEPVTAVLLERERDPFGLTPMVTSSIVAHAVALAIILLGPPLTGKPVQAPRTTMTIVLGGGAPGPRTGGTRQLSSTPIQAAAAAPDVTKRAPALPPAAKTPEMVLPSKTGKPAPRAPVKSAPDDAKGRTPTRGAEPRQGAAVAETGVKTSTTDPGGLASGGSGGIGATLDVGNFCCPEYITTMVDLIHRNWNPRQGVEVEPTIKFTIQRDGTITDIVLDKSSGNDLIDLASKRALLLTRKLPPLPTAFTNPTLTVFLSFRFQK